MIDQLEIAKLIMFKEIDEFGDFHIRRILGVEPDKKSFRIYKEKIVGSLKRKGYVQNINFWIKGFVKVSILEDSVVFQHDIQGRVPFELTGDINKYFHSTLEYYENGGIAN